MIFLKIFRNINQKKKNQLTIPFKIRKSGEKKETIKRNKLIELILYQPIKNSLVMISMVDSSISDQFKMIYNIFLMLILLIIWYDSAVHFLFSLKFCKIIILLFISNIFHPSIVWFQLFEKMNELVLFLTLQWLSNSFL